MGKSVPVTKKRVGNAKLYYHHQSCVVGLKKVVVVVEGIILQLPFSGKPQVAKGWLVGWPRNEQLQEGEGDGSTFDSLE